MVSFYEAFEKERSSDISHHGVKGMKWGIINKRDLKGGKAGGIVRGMQRSSNVRSMENWNLKDAVDRMRLESDYRRLSEEEETYAATQAEKIKTAKMEKVTATIAMVSGAVGLAGGVLGLVKTLGFDPANPMKKIREKIAIRRNNKQMSMDI